jgi:Uri superfamily endonuclease
MSTCKSNSMKNLEIVDLQSFSTSAPVASSFIAYQIYFKLSVPLTLKIGKMGSRDLPAGDYVYTGSAKRNIRGRVLRHLERAKSLHWHIDYLLSGPGISISKIILSRSSECRLNKSTEGGIIVPRFGSTDCKEGCGSHLKFIDENSRTKRQRETKVRPFRKA